jgi:hypothetical protein
MRQPLCRSAERVCWVLSFGSIYTDQAHTLTVFHKQRIAIDYTLHNAVTTVKGSSAIRNATPEQGENGTHDERDDYRCEFGRATASTNVTGHQPRIFRQEKESVKYNVAGS